MNSERLKQFIKVNSLLLSILAGVIIGCVIGISIHDAVQLSDNPSPERLTMYVKFLGELFIRMLKMIIVPLITSSTIVAVTDSDISTAGRLGKRTFAYYLTTTVISSTLGLILALAVQPGKGVNEKGEEILELYQNTMDSFLDLLRNCFPDNIVEATMKSVSNVLAYNFGGTEKENGTNMVGLIVISIAFGVVLNMIGEEGKPLINIFKSLWTSTMKLVEIIMWFSPVGIGSIITGNIVETEEMLSLFHAMGMYVLSCMSAFMIQAVLLYPALYVIFSRRNPIQHFVNVFPALLTAFGTASSAATLPTTIDCCESKANIDKRVTRFVLPIGATCNMDGTAVALAITVVFIDQIEPTINLSLGKIIVTIVVCTFVSIGAAGIPNADFAYVVIVLGAVGLPLDKIGPIVTVEWFLDRAETTINVLGDTFAAAIVEHFSSEDLKGPGR